MADAEKLSFPVAFPAALCYDTSLPESRLKKEPRLSLRRKEPFAAMIFETHAHYDDSAFDEDRESLIASLPEHGIRRVVDVGSTLASTKKALEIAERYPFVYAAAGVHPSECAELTEESFLWLKEQLDHPKAVALGEIGLDYYWPEPEHELQKKWFVRQLLLAQEKDKPVVIHSRDAAKDTLDLMKSEAAKGLTGVIHCFSYSVEISREYLNMGYFLGIGGVLTYKNGKKLREVVEYAPMSQLVLETDCPYLTPVPFRGKRNSSLNLPYVVEEMARIKGIHAEEVEQITYENACRLYRLAP